MFKKVNNYHIFFLIIIVFILNTILFKSIDITKAQWTSPDQPPGVATGNIVTSPLSASLDLGGFDILGDGNIDINGKFHLYGGDDNTDWKFETGDGQPGVHIISGGGEYNDPFLLFQAGEDASSNRASIFMNSVSKKLHLATQETIAFTIDVNSNIGIGTDSPNRKLHIKTNSNDEFINAEIGIQSGNNTHWGIYQEINSGNLKFWNFEDRVVFTDEGIETDKIELEEVCLNGVCIDNWKDLKRLFNMIN